MSNPYNKSGYPTAYRPGAAKYGAGLSDAPKPQWARAPGWVEREATKLGWAERPSGWAHPMWLKSPPSVPSARTGPWSLAGQVPAYLDGPWGKVARGVAGSLKPAGRFIPIVGKIIDAAELLENATDLLTNLGVNPAINVPEDFGLGSTWTQVANCGRPREQVFVRFNNCSNFACSLTNQAFGTPTSAWPGPYFEGVGTTNATHITVWDKLTNGNYSLSLFFRRTTCPGVGAVPVMNYTAAYTIPKSLAPASGADRQPEVDPNTQTKPGTFTSPFARPVPWALAPYVRTNRDRAPSERSDRGYPPKPPRPVITRPTRPTKPNRPPKKVKERKFRLNGFGGPLRTFLEAAMEAKDVGDCLADSAGAPKGALAGRLQWTYTNADKINGCKFVECLVNNEIEDRAIGMLGKLAKAEAQATGRSHGLSGLSKKLGGDLSWLKISLGC